MAAAADSSAIFVEVTTFGEELTEAYEAGEVVCLCRPGVCGACPDAKSQDPITAASPEA